MAKKPVVKYCVVDAFTGKAFKGNPAAVCLLLEQGEGGGEENSSVRDEEEKERWLQSVAAEFNLSETCYLTPFFSPTPSTTPRFRLRWFTPAAEVELCGHATLAAAHVLFTSALVDGDTVEFVTLSGILTARRVEQLENLTNSSHLESGDAAGGGGFYIELDFPVVPLAEALNSVEVSQVSECLNGASVIDIKKTTTEDDLFVVLPDAKTVAEIEPLFEKIQNLPCRGMTITGVAPPESGFDIYSRFFCPKLGIKEDPVTGSAHCALASYWSQKLGKSDLVAYQASPRGGILNVHLDENRQRVLLRGKAITVMEGSLLV